MIMLPPMLLGWAFLALRFVIGLILIYHGQPKLHDRVHTAKNFDAMGFRPGKFWGTFVGAVEYIGGFLLIAGVCTQFVAAVFTIQFIVINIWRVRTKQEFRAAELDLVMLAALAVIVAFGAGEISVDWALSYGY